MDIIMEWFKDNWIPLAIIGSYIFMIPIVVFIAARFGDCVDVSDVAGLAIFWPFALFLVIVFYPLKWLIEIPFKLGEEGWKKKHISKDDDYHYNDTEEDDY